MISIFKKLLFNRITLAQLISSALMLSTSLHAGFNNIAVIPQPSQMQVKEGQFEITANTQIILLNSSPQVKKSASIFLQRIKQSTGFNLEILELSKARKSNNSKLLLSLVSTEEIKGKEAYHISVDKNQIKLNASTNTGIFYGLQTLLQLLPVEIYSSSVISDIDWTVPCAIINDESRFEWRGYMLDVSRHFFNKDALLRQIDFLAMHKINRFHLHLTDDTGWRIEIKKYPRLSTVGAFYTVENENDKAIGGFYTQADLKEIVQYAEDRQVMIIPEIDLPGHARALAKSCPEVICNPESLITIKPHYDGVGPNVVCPSKEITYEIITDILTEVADIFPSPYIHLGGDEVSKRYWDKCKHCREGAGVEAGDSDAVKWGKLDLIPMFMRRLNDIARSLNKTMIGWDEIAENEIPEGAIIQSWRGGFPGLKAAERGHKVIMSPSPYLYLDYPEGRVTLEEVYHFKPFVRYDSKVIKNNVIGMEACLWTESVADSATIDYLTWPRMSALSESAWSPDKKLNYSNFMHKLKTHKKRLKLLGINHTPIHPGTLVARLTPDMQALKGDIIDIDLSPHIQEDGTWVMTATWDGANGLSTSESLLIIDNKVVQTLPAMSLGWRDLNNKTNLYVKDLKPKSTITLRMKLRRKEKELAKEIDTFCRIYIQKTDEEKSSSNQGSNKFSQARKDYEPKDFE
jgi:hexosaminidase